MEMTITVGADGLCRGPFGEIYCPPLLDGDDPDEALEGYHQQTIEDGCPVDMPTRGLSREGMQEIGGVRLHVQRLRATLCGEYQSEDSVPVLLAVMNGEPLSVRPLGLEQLYFSTFAPILRRLGPNQWRLGREDFGRHADLIGPTGDVWDKAMALYVQWSEEEETLFNDTVTGILQKRSAALRHYYWAALMRQGEIVEIADGVGCVRMNHDIHAVESPRGFRPIGTSSTLRTARIAEMLALQQRIPLNPVDISDVVPALESLFDDAPTKDDGVLSMGLTRARWLGSGARLAVIVVGETQYLLQLRSAKQVLEIRQLNDKRAIATFDVSSDRDWPAQAIEGSEIPQRAYLLLAAVHLSRRNL